jgi:hypothetical protein
MMLSQPVETSQEDSCLYSGDDRLRDRGELSAIGLCDELHRLGGVVNRDTGVPEIFRVAGNDRVDVCDAPCSGQYGVLEILEVRGDRGFKDGAACQASWGCREQNRDVH